MKNDIKMDDKKMKKVKQSMGIIIILIGILYAAANLFLYFENNIFSTYLVHILDLPYYYISIMISSSALIGLVMLFLFGIISDNTRSKFGRRRPYLLFGIIAGVAMILFAYSNNFLICFILDVIVIGIAANAYYTAQRVLIPDLIELEYRGRVNGKVGIISNVGVFIAIGLTILADNFFTVPKGSGKVVTQEGYLFMLSIGGITFIITGLLGFLFIREVAISELPPKKKFYDEFKEIFQFQELKKNRDFYKMILANTIYLTGVSVINPFIFSFLWSLGLNTIELAIMILGTLPTVFVVTFILGKTTDKYGRKKTILPAILISLFGFFFIPFIITSSELNLPLIIIMSTLILIPFMAIAIVVNTWSQDLLPPETRGKFNGIWNLSSTINQIIGSIIGGFVATVYGLVWIFPFAALFFLGSIPLFTQVKETLKRKKNSIST